MNNENKPDDKDGQVNPDHIDNNELFNALARYDIERRYKAKVEMRNLKRAKARADRKKAKKHRRKFK